MIPITEKEDKWIEVPSAHPFNEDQLPEWLIKKIQETDDSSEDERIEIEIDLSEDDQAAQSKGSTIEEELKMEI